MQSQIRLFLFGCIVFAVCCGWRPVRSDETIFSGPQVGEKIPPFKALNLRGDAKGQEFDVLSDVQDKPVVLIFFHELTRPAFGMTISLMQYALDQQDAGLCSSVIFLAADPNKAMNQGALRYFPEAAALGVSPDGAEGPGAYGLNRNVTLTILVAKEQKVTANFALVQPSLQADGPRVLKAIAAAIGQEPPTIEELEAGRQRAMSARGPGMRRRASGTRGRDPSQAELDALLRSLIDKQATKEQLKQTAEKIEALIEKNESLAKELRRRAKTIVESDRLANYGTSVAQEFIQGWAESEETK